MALYGLTWKEVQKADGGLVGADGDLVVGVLDGGARLQHHLQRDVHPLRLDVRRARARDVDGVDEQLERVRDAVRAVQVHERVERGRFRQAGLSGAEDQMVVQLDFTPE